MAIKKSAKASVKKAKFLELDNTNIMVEYAKRDAKGNVIDETYKKVDRFREWDETEAHLKLLDSPDSSCPDIVKYTDTRWDLVTIEDGSFKYIDGSANIFTHTTYSNPVFTESTGGVTITNPNSIDMTANITNFVTESVSLSANSGDLKRISKGYTAGTYTIDCQLLSVTGKGWSNKASYTFNVTQLEMPTISDSQIKIFITNPNSVDVDCYYSNYLSGTVSIGAGKTITLDKTNVLGTFTLDAYLRCEGYADSNNKSYTFLVEKYTLSNPTVKFISSSASISIYNPNGVNVTAKITFGSSTKTISVPATTTTTTTTN